MGILGPLYNLLQHGTWHLRLPPVDSAGLEGRRDRAGGVPAHPKSRPAPLPGRVYGCSAPAGPLLVLGLKATTSWPPLLYALEVASLTVMCWAFLSPLIGRRAGRWFLIVQSTAIIGFTLLFFPLWYPLARSVPFFEYTAFWQQTIWDIWATLLAIFAGLYLLLQRQRVEYLLPGIAFLIIAFGNGLVTLDRTGLGRLVNLFGYPLISVVVYRAALQDLWSYRQELQTAERTLSAADAGTAFPPGSQPGTPASLELEPILKQVAEHIAQALDADRVAVLLRPAEEPGDMSEEEVLGRLRLMTLYAP